jgi:hypothetical protein
MPPVRIACAVSRKRVDDALTSFFVNPYRLPRPEMKLKEKDIVTIKQQIPNAGLASLASESEAVDNVMMQS